MTSARALAGGLRARALGAVARRSPARRGVVLAYHRIGDATEDRAHSLVPALGRDDFERHLRHLASRYDVVPASRILESVRERRPRAGFPVALTFDDDLASHVTHACPALAAHGTAAAFFLCGASLERPFAFWWEDLQALYSRGELEPSLLANLADEHVRPVLAREPHSLRRLAAEIERLEPRRRAELAEALRAARGRPPQDAGIRATQVRSLADAGFEIGFHTLRHDLLTSLEGRALDAALADGRRELEGAAGRELSLVSYPHGKADERVAAAAARAGFAVGFTGLGRTVEPHQSKWLVTRIEPAADPGALAAQLARAVAGR